MRIILSNAATRRWLGGRPALWAAAVLALTALAVYVVLPLVASSRIVRDRIAVEMSAWSGYRVSIGAPPEIRLFPLRAVLTDIELHDGAEDEPPVLSADQVVLNLSAIAALTGDVSFSKARLVRPLLSVARAGSGIYMPRLPGGGRMASALASAQRVTDEDPLNPDPAAMPTDPMGSIEFSDGRIVEPDSETELVAAASGILVWPRLDRPASLQATGIWRGEQVVVEASAEEPMVLFSGGLTLVHAALSAQPFNARFDGTANLSKQPYFDGEMAFTATSLPKMLDWLQVDLPALPQVTTFSLQGSVQGNAARLKLNDLALSIDGNSGTAVVDVSLAEKPPVISATFDFQKVDLTSLASILLPVEANGLLFETHAGVNFTSKVSLDVRLSAAQAIFGSLPLSELAATAQIRNGLAAFDISDATAFGGTVQAGVRFDRKPDGVQLLGSVRASNIDTAAFAAATGLSHMFPSGRANLALNVKGPAEPWHDVPQQLEGTVSTTFGPGRIANFNLDQFKAKAREGGFFALSDLASGELDFDSIDVNGTIANGIARIGDARIKAGTTLMRLTGIVSYIGQGLALRGALFPGQPAATPDGTIEPEASFFVGGTWSEPIVSPAFQPPE